MEWWQKLIFTVVIIVFVFGLIFAVTFFIFLGIEKISQPKVIKEIVKETQAAIEVETVEVEIEKEVEDVKVEDVSIPEPYESEGGIPYNGSEWDCDVAPNEIQVLTGGPAEINGVKLPGGTNPDRGSVILLLPEDIVISYTVRELIAGSNWHGAYDYNRVPTEDDWQLLVENRVEAMMEAPNGTSGKGCQIVDVLVVQGEKIVFQNTYQN